MICLDANYLILGLAPGSAEAASLAKWYLGGEPLIVSSIAWYEFLCGPVTELQIHTMGCFLPGGPVTFGEAEAMEAARLFNAVRRARHLRVDAMIAATAIVANARLATSNEADFKNFVPYGLKLIR